MNENFIVILSNTVLEKATATGAFPPLITDESLAIQAAEPMILTVIKINMNLIEVSLVTMIDLINKTVMHGIWRDQVDITMCNMIRAAMSAIAVMEELAVTVHLTNMTPKDLMITVGDTKTNHLRVLQGRKMTTAESHEE